MKVMSAVPGVTKTLHTSNPRAGYLTYRDEIDAAIRSVLDSDAYVLGPQVAAFEAAFAAYAGVSHGVGVNSGTDAIHLALRALGIGPGDEVICPSHTAVAGVAAIEMSGAVPVFAEVEDDWWCIDPDAVKKVIGPRTRAVVAVHLYGQPANLTRLRGICDEHGLFLVEDCAQSHGAAWQGRPTGASGDASCFSFYPTKNLGAVGDGGMVLTNDTALAERLRMLRQYGWRQPQRSEIAGFNSRLDPLQAAILSVKLKHLPEIVSQRREKASAYDAGLAGLPVTLPRERPGGRHAYHLYVIRMESHESRNALMAHLARHDIAAGIHYPSPVHLQPAYAGRLRHGSLALTEELARTILSLPLFPELSPAEQGKVISAVRSFLAGKGAAP